MQHNGILEVGLTIDNTPSFHPSEWLPVADNPSTIQTTLF
jgi:hypothetical protein